MPQKSNTQEFIAKARAVHGDKYGYDKVCYAHSHIQIIITCPTHGDFLQRATNHLCGRGCNKCGEDNGQRTQKLSTQEFIEKAKNIHGDKYNYNLVNYNNNSAKVIIICPEHGYFHQTPNNHLGGSGCNKCGISSMCEKTASSIQEFIAKAKVIHNNKYDYDLVEYKNSKTIVQIKCKKHGGFEQTPSHHLQGQGCPKCKMSKGEIKIMYWFEKYKIKYIPQYKFANCKNQQPLPFDFYLPNHNKVIEYQGAQHFHVVPRSKDPIKNAKALNRIKKTDQIKRDYCKQNGITRIAIPYWDYDEIENILAQALNL